MKIPLSILGIVAMILAAFYLIAPSPDPDTFTARTDLPWQVQVNPDGTVRVLDITLGRSTLADAIDKFGGVEGLAVFEGSDGTMALEAYFGTVQFGPLKAKVIATLDSSRVELDALKSAAPSRDGSPSGDWKYPLSEGPAPHADKPVQGLTYIPGTRALDEAFLLERFGRPAAMLRESEQAVSWFYPERGLSVLLDDEAREVFEYRLPQNFELPAGSQPYNP